MNCELCHPLPLIHVPPPDRSWSGYSVSLSFPRPSVRQFQHQHNDDHDDDDNNDGDEAMIHSPSSGLFCCDKIEMLLLQTASINWEIPDGI